MGLLDRVSFTKQHVEPPEAIDVTEKGDVRIAWPGGPAVTLPALRLRDACPCAACIEEGTGKKILDPTTIPADIRPEQIAAVGSYAVQIQWSDGHNTGIYTWQVLRDACGLGSQR
jgi:DUF971 family protein